MIVGRGSQHFLENRADTLRVFLYAPRDEKVRRVMARGCSEIEAQERVDNVDQERMEFIQQIFQRGMAVALALPRDDQYLHRRRDRGSDDSGLHENARYHGLSWEDRASRARNSPTAEFYGLALWIGCSSGNHFAKDFPTSPREPAFLATIEC